MPDQVECARCGESKPAIERRISFRSPLKEQVQEEICADCWDEWQEMQVQVINEYALNLGDPRSHRIIEDHAREFLRLPEPEED